MSFIGVSDTHGGSIYSIRSTPKNELQQMLLDGFIKCKDRIKQPKRVEELFLGGDMVDGPNAAKPGLGLWTVHPEVAVFDIALLLSPLVKMAKAVRVVRGSGYHVEPGRGLVNYDEMLAQKLEAKPFENSLLKEKPFLLEQLKQLDTIKSNAPRLKQFRAEALSLLNNGSTELEYKSDIPFPRSGIKYKNIFNNVLITLKHHVAFSPNYMYRGTGLTRNDVIMSLQKDRQITGDYTAIVNIYGHVHYHHFTGNATHLNFTIPCWKAKDDFLADKDPSEPDFGIVELILEPNGEFELHPYTLSGKDYPVSH